MVGATLFSIAAPNERLKEMETRVALFGVLTAAASAVCFRLWWLLSPRSVPRALSPPAEHFQHGDVVGICSMRAHSGAFVRGYTGERWSHCGVVLVIKSRRFLLHADASNVRFDHLSNRFRAGVQLSDLQATYLQFPHLYRVQVISRDICRRRRRRSVTTKSLSAETRALRFTRRLTTLAAPVVRSLTGWQPPVPIGETFCSNFVARLLGLSPASSPGDFIYYHKSC
jgi:hypothetical protein